MDPEVVRILELHGGVATRRELERAGMTSPTLAAALRARRLQRVSWGVYADPPVWSEAAEWDRFRLRVEATLRRHPSWVASHHAALVLHGLPLYRVDLERVDVAAPIRNSAVRSAVHVHPLPDGDAHLASASPRALPVPLACVLTAAASGIDAGVVAMDAALHGGHCAASDLDEALDDPRVRYGRRNAAAALARSDGSSESPGESRTRLLLEELGVPFRTQVDVHDAAGFVGRVDFLVAGRVVVEFDGAVKYEGAEGRAALVREKQREDRLREAGYIVIRVTWSDLDRPAVLMARVRAALARAASAPDESAS
jgi:very-short-patch-repair endonuclease